MTPILDFQFYLIISIGSDENSLELTRNGHILATPAPAGYRPVARE